ncbi:MAG TPA: winged helix-turn-helix domain-containing protein [Candidatus Limnocylindrales bacterium]|jgi:DNA-binding winged helix-turn-helix (wHTH) protein|nr:winged helix-turn-helix domain-containing protein [Candidatus Limnocylindrales bacterium]
MPPPVARYRFDDFEADLRAAELRRRGIRLKLQLQPFQLLVALLERPQDVVTREELCQRLWPDDTFVDFDHGLNTAVAKLRDVLGDSASKPKYIETIAKRGYRFVGTVESVAAPTPPVPASTSTPVALETVTIPAPPQKGAQTSPGVSAESSGSPAPASHSDISAQQDAPQAERPPGEHELPLASRQLSRTLFILAQVMYLIFYFSALFRLDNLHASADMAWHSAGLIAFILYLVTALVGVAVRLYLISATSLDYHLLGQKVRVIFPALFVLDMIWALSPLLISDRIGFGLALAATAALIYMPFAQRTLVKMIEAAD